jgi:hypothetical protein
MSTFLIAYLCIGIVQVARVNMTDKPDDMSVSDHVWTEALCLVIICLTWPVWFGRAGL